MKRDPRRIKSEEKLYDAYLSLLIEGHEQLTIQQICNKADVTRPTFYKLFKDIHKLRLNLLKNILYKLKQALVIQVPKSIDSIKKEDILENIILLCEHIQENHIAYETLLIYHPDALFTDGILKILKEYVKDGIYLSQSRPYLINVKEQLIIAYVAGAYLESIRWWIKENYATPPIEIASTLIDLSLNGPYVKRIP